MALIMLPHIFLREDDYSPTLGEYWEPYRLTLAFQHEVRYRESFADYCAWYAAEAAHNRATLAAMQREPNWLQWFRRS